MQYSEVNITELYRVLTGAKLGKSQYDINS
jgi:hypothetical protein